MNVQSILQAKGSDVASIRPDITLDAAVASLAEHRVGALVVCDDAGSLVGILSERDIVRSLAASGDAARSMAVSTAMSSDVVTCQPADTIEQLMSLMTERRIRHLPVLDSQGAIIGIVSIGDVVKFRLVELERENSQLHDYIDGRV